MKIVASSIIFDVELVIATPSERLVPACSSFGLSKAAGQFRLMEKKHGVATNLFMRLDRRPRTL